MSRAGHCPTLFFEEKTKETTYFKTKGLGLGILRSPSYADHIETFTRNYCTGDTILFYTDGIVEAKNALKEEYGFERLIHITGEAIINNQKELLNTLKSDLFHFCGHENMEDDVTLLTIRLT